MADLKVYSNDASTVLVTVYPDGSVTVATRTEPDDIWGPPIKVEERPVTDDLERARARREKQEAEAARRLVDELFPPVDPRYRRAAERANVKPAPPVFACTSADIDAGMFWMDHGYYPEGRDAP